MTEEDLKEFFSPSRVKEVRILRERDTARPRVCLLYLRFWILWLQSLVYVMQVLECVNALFVIGG